MSRVGSAKMAINSNKNTSYLDLLAVPAAVLGLPGAAHNAGVPNFPDVDGIPESFLSRRQRGAYVTAARYGMLKLCSAPSVA